MADHRLVPFLALLTVPLLAGCVQVPEPGPAPDLKLPPPPYVPLVTIEPANVMMFGESIVMPAVGTVSDLYEPTMEVSDTGAIYVAGHVAGAATTGTPAYVSTDDGKTWKQLPLAGPLSAPSPIQGAQPPPGDEGFIVAGAEGEAWMADIYAAGFTVSGWCDDGAELCYDNRYAFDRTQTVLQREGCEADPAVALNDRPWAAYANGTLLLVNNPGSGVMQLGVMAVPPATPAGLFDPVTGPKWNMCASPTGFIPGIPALRDDGLFAVPQMDGSGKKQTLNVVLGNVADIMTVQEKTVLRVTNSYTGVSNYGQATFDADGTLFLAAYNNTGKPGTAVGKVQGRFILATSTDSGASFVNVTFVTGSPVRSVYIDGNMAGPGALVVWSQLGDDTGHSDWYVAHVQAGPNGEPLLGDVSLAVDEGPNSAAHVMGSAAGPDGRAYFVLYNGASPTQYAGSTPLSVWIQKDGPTLPVTAAAATAEQAE